MRAKTKVKSVIVDPSTGQQFELKLTVKSDTKTDYALENLVSITLLAAVSSVNYYIKEDDMEIPF